MSEKTQHIFYHSLPWRALKRLSIWQILCLLLLVLATLITATLSFRDAAYLAMEKRGSEDLDYLSYRIKNMSPDPSSWCGRPSLELSQRMTYTLLNWEGHLLCQDGELITSRVNQSHYPEVVQARSQGIGLHRGEDQTGIPSLHIAKTFNHPEIDSPFFIRLSIPHDAIKLGHQIFIERLIKFVLPLSLFFFLLLLWQTRQLIHPLKSIIAKIESLKTIPNTSQSGEGLLSAEEQWISVEKALDLIKDDIERYINDLFNENAKITTLMESISDSILALDLEGKILFANRHFKKNFSSSATDHTLNIIGMKVWEITRDLNIQELIKKSLAEKTIVKLRSHPMKIKLGDSENYFDITVSPLINSENKTIGNVIVFHNVSERIKADQMREDFVANVSHEVRTPLTAIKGHVQLLKTLVGHIPVDEAENISHSLKILEKNSDRLTLLFQDILNLSVIESKQKLQKEKIYTQEITENVISNVKQSYPEKKIEIKTYFDCEEVWGEAPLLEQVLTNLIDNAYKYTPEEGGKISILWAHTDEHVIFEIMDNAPGIPKEHHLRVFERFYRVDSSRSRQLGGTGLGLAIVKHIVQKHLGSINLKNSPEGGNIFSLSLPLKKESESRPSISYV